MTAEYLKAIEQMVKPGQENYAHVTSLLEEVWSLRDDNECLREELDRAEEALSLIRAVCAINVAGEE